MSFRTRRRHSGHGVRVYNEGPVTCQLPRAITHARQGLSHRVNVNVFSQPRPLLCAVQLALTSDPSALTPDPQGHSHATSPLVTPSCIISSRRGSHEWRSGQEAAAAGVF